MTDSIETRGATAGEYWFVEKGEQKNVSTQPEPVSKKMLGWEYLPQRTRYCVYVSVHREDDQFIAEARTLPGALSQGDSVKEALANIREAVAGCIVSYQAAEEAIPFEKPGRIENPETFEFIGWIDVDVEGSAS